MSILVKLFIIYVCLQAASCDDVFKNCSSVDFCSRLRNQEPVLLYRAEGTSFNLVDGATAEITLVPLDNGDNLTLSIRNYPNAFRVIIQEASSSRYNLTNVLVDDIAPVSFDSVEESETEIFLRRNTTTAVLNSESVAIEFYTDDVLQSVLNASTLFFDNASNSQSFKFGFTFPDALRLYGIHEHTDHLALRDTVANNIDPYRLKNMDRPGQPLYAPLALYGAVPVLYAHSVNTTTGIFLHNAAQQWYDIQYNVGTGANASIIVESGLLDCFVLAGPKPEDVVRQYTNLTGKAHLPPYWALGYHQSRYNYDNQSDVKEVIAQLDAHDFPVDVIWLDIDYTDGKKYFTWDPVKFSDPVEMQQNLSATNRRLITIIDPHIKVDDSYWVYEEANEGGYFLKYENGSNFEGQCWPGLSSWWDFLDPDAASYYASMYQYDNFKGSTPTLGGIWNDMNEPSIFDTNDWEKTFPDNLVHYGDVVHKDIHNTYGFLQTKATHQGLLDRDNGTVRPFILSRSHFAGTQRYSAIWTGDNIADWGYLAISLSECLNANILGICLCGADIGGFLGSPNEELLQRWFQAGAWLPFYREHSNHDTDRREPYVHSDEVQGVIRDALYLRYSHIPYWYTLFFEHAVNGTPVIRPLFYEYPEDSNVVDIDDHLLVGKSILVRPVTEAGVNDVNVYFPGDQTVWYGSNNQTFKGGNKASIPVNISSIPVFYKSGTIVGLCEQQIKTTEDVKNSVCPFAIHGYADENGLAEGTLYIDDYISFRYRDNNDYIYVHIFMNSTTLGIRALHADSSKSRLNIDRVVLHSFNEDNEGFSTSRVFNLGENMEVFVDGTEDVILNLE